MGEGQGSVLIGLVGIKSDALVVKITFTELIRFLFKVGLFDQPPIIPDLDGCWQTKHDGTPLMFCRPLAGRVLWLVDQPRALRSVYSMPLAW